MFTERAGSEHTVSVPVMHFETEPLRRAAQLTLVRTAQERVEDDWCGPVTPLLPEIARLASQCKMRRKIKAGAALFRTGDGSDGIYVVQSGFMKTVILRDGGRDQVTGFFMPGEVFGLAGLGLGEQTCEAVALEDSNVILIPQGMLDCATDERHSVRHALQHLIGDEMVREQAMMFVLGTLHAEERLAAFLLNLSRRLAMRGFSALEFIMRMTRDEIASYLGMKMELSLIHI